MCNETFDVDEVEDEEEVEEWREVKRPRSDTSGGTLTSPRFSREMATSDLLKAPSHAFVIVSCQLTLSDPSSSSEAESYRAEVDGFFLGL